MVLIMLLLIIEISSLFLEKLKEPYISLAPEQSIFVKENQLYNLVTLQGGKGIYIVYKLNICPTCPGDNFTIKNVYMLQPD